MRTITLHTVLALSLVLVGCQKASKEDKGIQETVKAAQGQGELKVVEKPVETKKLSKEDEVRQNLLSRIYKLTEAYRKDGVEVRKSRKSPAWRLVDPSLAKRPDSERKERAKALAAKFKGEMETVIGKAIAVEVYADDEEKLKLF